MWNHIDMSDASIATIAMIEDPVALDNIAQIVAVEGLDGVFIGRGDLTVAFGAANRNDEVVVRAINRIFEAARVADKAVWVMVDSGTEAQTFLASGATAVIVSSDQALLRKAAAAAAHEARLSIVQG
jgi:2-keto-3-deoxy-L-rhamnonate aldolase RhmA